uniref:ATP synthase membrane subunit f n=1 Tax=Callorhinchus milii TaxID=7868 RepID=A0A4W3GXJ7_CALMI
RWSFFPGTDTAGVSTRPLEPSRLSLSLSLSRALYPFLPAVDAWPPAVDTTGFLVSPVPVTQKRLLDVKLGELGKWSMARDFTPNGILQAIRRGHDRYYNKYINVKRGGIGGVAMLLGGYVVISYIWSFEHIKHDRWRKYH